VEQGAAEAGEDPALHGDDAGRGSKRHRGDKAERAFYVPPHRAQRGGGLAHGAGRASADNDRNASHFLPGGGADRKRPHDDCRFQVGASERDVGARDNSR
jgi:hypothetical protein